MFRNESPRVDARFDRPHRPIRSATFHLVTTVVAPVVEDRARTERPPLNLSFIVDRSGSMSGGKLDLARQGVEFALGLLDKRDTVSLVVYDNEVDRLLSQRKAGNDARDKAARRLRRIHPRGSTALADGWATGCRELSTIVDGHTTDRGLCRTILLTDGLANVGETDPVTLARDAGELALRGITTTTFGVGDSFDEVLLAGMADSGRGRYHYIANSAGIAPVFAGELGELLHVTMRDAVLSMRFPRGWRAQILNDLPLEQQGSWTHIQLGDLASGNCPPVVWSIDAPDAGTGELDTVEIQLRWTTVEGAPDQTQRFNQTIEARQDRGPEDSVVLDQVATMLGARARAEALAHNRAGRYDLARKAVQHHVSAMPASAQGIILAAELRELAVELSAPLSAARRKDQHFRARRASRAQHDYSEDRSG